MLKPGHQTGQQAVLPDRPGKPQGCGRGGRRPPQTPGAGTDRRDHRAAGAAREDWSFSQGRQVLKENIQGYVQERALAANRKEPGGSNTFIVCLSPQRNNVQRAEQKSETQGVATPVRRRHTKKYAEHWACPPQHRRSDFWRRHHFQSSQILWSKLHIFPWRPSYHWTLAHYTLPPLVYQGNTID